QDRIKPIWLPAIVERIEQARVVTVKMDHVRMVGRVLESDHHRLSWRGLEQRAAEVLRTVSRIVERDIEPDGGGKVHALRQRIVGQRLRIGPKRRTRRRALAIDEARKRDFALVES